MPAKRRESLLLNKQELIELDITGITAEGDGIGRFGSLAVFVPGTCPGDKALVRLVKKRPSYAHGRLVSLLCASQHRTERFCSASPRCGGCQFDHIEYGEQLILKKQLVADCLSRIGGFDVDGLVCNSLGMRQPFRYRNKMVFPVAAGQNGLPVGGFYARKSHDVIPLADCLLGPAEAAAYLKALLTFMEEYHLPPYQEETHSGLVRRLFVRFGYHTKEAMAVLSINGTRLRGEDRLVQQMCAAQRDYQLSSIILNCNTGRNNLVLGSENRVLFGTDTITDTLLGVRFQISPNSFYQVNPAQTEVLYSKALEFAGLDKTQTAVDLYCGIGTISLCAAQSAKHVVGVEIVPQAVADAKKNAALNNIGNIEFLEGRADIICPQLLARGLMPDVVFLDPPRKGSDEVTLGAVLNMSPAKIVYISCNPATLARDLKYLAAGGYQLLKVQPVDLFPHTGHVETIVLLQRRDT